MNTTTSHTASNNPRVLPGGSVTRFQAARALPLHDFGNGRETGNFLNMPFQAVESVKSLTEKTVKHLDIREISRKTGKNEHLARELSLTMNGRGQEKGGGVFCFSFNFKEKKEINYDSFT